MIGKVVAVNGPIVDIAFSGQGQLPKIYELLEAAKSDGKKIFFEIVEHSGQNLVRCISFQPTYGLMRQASVQRTGGPIRINKAKTVVGRVLDVLGRPIDKRGSLPEQADIAIKKESLSHSRTLDTKLFESEQILETGIKVVDLLFPLVKGSKTGIIGGAALGKSLLTLEIIRNIVKLHRGSCVFCGAGERTREGNELYYEFKETDVLDKIAMVFGQMNESPAARFEVVNTGITLAESFQREGKDVLFFLDNVYRFVQAGGELSALLGRIPSESGYQPTLASEVGNFHERIRWRQGSSITAVETVYVPADDITDPAVVAILAYLDSVILLSRAHVQEGLYPAIDPLQSSSAFLNPQIIGNRHFDISQKVLGILRQYDELSRLVAIIGVEELSETERQTYQRAKRIRAFLSQPFFTAEAYTGKKGQYVRLDKTITGCEKILRGDLDRVNEAKLYMIGSLD